MPLTITKISESFSTSPQIEANDVKEIASLGFKTIINNRPNNEGGVEQPSGDAIKAAAEKAGLAYLYLPVTPSNITEGNVAECAAFISDAATPILGFCRTGVRAGNLYQQAITKNNQDSDTSKKDQNWLMKPICNFFKNKCLVTKLIRKLSGK